MSDYSRFKNHLHNTLKITKEDIRGMVEKAVYKVVERKVEVMLADKYTAQRIVDRAINERLTRNNMFWHKDNELDKYIKNAVVDKLLNGIKLEVSVKQPVKRVKK